MDVLERIAICHPDHAYQGTFEGMLPSTGFSTVHRSHFREGPIYALRHLTSTVRHLNEYLCCIHVARSRRESVEACEIRRKSAVRGGNAESGINARISLITN